MYKLKIYYTNGRTLVCGNFYELKPAKKEAEKISLLDWCKGVEIICTEEDVESEQETAEETAVEYSSDAVDATSQANLDIF